MKTKYDTAAKKLTYLCAMVYFCSYLTRINYAAVMVEMISSCGFTKESASFALVGLFITYGIGQVISGYLGDKLKPEKLIFAGLFVSAAMNLLIVFFNQTAAMTVIWCINGFAQAFMWPPLVKIMSGALMEKEYKKATVVVSWGSSFGTIFVYLTVPLFITVGSWKTVFVFSAAVALIMAFVWITLYNKLKNSLNEIVQEDRNTDIDAQRSRLFTPKILAMLGVVMLAIIMQGVLRDGITNWMPSYISEVFDMKNAVSILSSVILPVFSIISFQVASWLNRRYLKNELLCSGVIFGIGVVSLLILRTLGFSNIVIAVLSMALAVACMHGVNLILICMVPAYFKKTGRASLVSGVLNSSTYIGSAVSTYGIAKLSQLFGWSTTVTVWIAVAAVGAILCCIIVSAWAVYKKAVTV